MNPRQRLQEITIAVLEGISLENGPIIMVDMAVTRITSSGVYKINIGTFPENSFGTSRPSLLIAA